MSDKWVNFKRAFGSYDRRDGKATTLVNEVQVQANALRGLGRVVEANAMDLQHQQVLADLQLAQQSGDTTQGYKDLGLVKGQARAAMRDPVAQDAVNGMLAAIPPLLTKIQKHLDWKDTLNTKLQAQKDQLLNDHGLMNAATPKAEVEKLQDTARKLLDEVLKDFHPPSRNIRKTSIPTERAVAYKDMLKARYNIDVSTPIEPGIDKFYDALALLPASHIVHTSLKSVEISTGTGLGDYSKLGKHIRVNMATVKKHPTIKYEMEGASGKIDTFKVTTLHEVAHSIDDKVGIMTAPAGATFGDWDLTLDIDAVALAYWNSIMTAVGATHQVAMLAEIKKALGGQATARPVSMPDPNWKRAAATLKTCAAIAADTKPWNNKYSIGDRSYFQDDKTWRSYSLAARNALTVRAYQWRAPAEWFAEIYAASWMFKKKPAGTVDQSAAIYMYRGT